MIRHLSSLLSLSVAALFCGCQATYRHTLNFNPSEPIRIAVLPFAQVDSDGKLVQEDENLLIDSVDRKSTRLNSSHTDISRMPSSA